MATPKFTHLHSHTHYSLLDGLGKIPDIIAATKAKGMDSIAITDHGNMYGVIEFYQEATANEVKPIIGQEMYLAPRSHTQKAGKVDANPFHMILLATNDTGYKNLIQLTTKAQLDGYYYKPRIDKQLLAEHNEGLIALSGCLGGIISDAILRKTEADARKEIEEFLKIFGEDRFYFEVQHHPEEKEQNIVNEALYRFSKEYGVKPVATADFHYIDQADVDNHDVLLCIQTNRTVDESDRMDLRHLDLSMKPPEQMAEEFKDHPEAIASTQEIADKCNLEIVLGQQLLPHFPVPEKLTPEQHLRNMCYKGISMRYNLDEAPDGELPEGTTEEVKERLEFELDIINNTGFASYFLIVQDFVNYAHDQGILVGPGRGSAAGSLVSYLLRITNVDPIEYDLLFERFLNPERISMPDIDLDFADDRRDEVLRYVEEKYGRDHVAQIITFGTLAARMAVRDAGRALGLPYAYPDKIAKLIPMFKSLQQALDEVPELKQLYDAEIDSKRIIDSALKLEGVARHASIHACGVVISKEPLTAYLPLQRGDKNEDTIVTQYSLHPVEDIGLLKMDFLGLKNLTIIKNALEIIKRTKGVDIDMDSLSFDDPATYKLFQEARTTGVFQFESAGMKRYLRELGPTEIEDLISMVALYRPGPMEQIPEFIKRKRDPSLISYMHPKLEPILDKTYGVGVYQEQIMQIARDLAGFTLGEADVLRKAMGKKIKELIVEQREKFVRGAVNNGIEEATAKKIFEFIEPFAGYGFNRSHAACYAIVGYQTAYLKANYPAEFMAALLTSDEHDADRVAIEVDEVRQTGINVLPPDVNSSFANFTVVQDPEDETKEAIRFGLSAIKNVGDNIIDVIIKERQKNGEYKDLTDFVTRITSKDLNRKSLESLAKSGAMDHLEERQRLLDNMETILDFAKKMREMAIAGQTDIFGVLTTGDAEDSKPKVRLQQTPEAPKQTRLAWEKELLGLYISEHPMSEYEEKLRGKVDPIKEVIDNSPAGNEEVVRICGIITKVHKIWTRKQQAMMFVTVEDTSSSVEVIVFPNLLQEEGEETWAEDNVIIVEGKRSDKDGTPKILADKGRKFSENYLKHVQKEEKKAAPPKQSSHKVAEGETPERLQIQLTNTTSPENLRTLQEYLANSHVDKGETSVMLAISTGSVQKMIETKYHLAYSQEVAQKIESIIGEGSITYQ